MPSFCATRGPISSWCSLRSAVMRRISVELAEALRFGCADQHPLPHILVSADERVRERVAAACPANPIESLPDVRTAAGREALVARLRAVRRRAQGDVVLRDEALEAAARAMAANAKADVVLLDVTGGQTSVIHARPDGVVLGIHERLGVGASADRVVARAGLDRVRRWMPRAVEAPALLERVFNRARWPDAIPASVLALSLEMALAREAIAHTLADAERAGISLDGPFAAPLVVLTGRLAELPRAAQSLLVAIDAFGPTAPTLVARAPGDALVAAGALAARGRVAAMPAAADPIAIVSVDVAAALDHGARQRRERRHRGTHRARLPRPHSNEGRGRAKSSNGSASTAAGKAAAKAKKPAATKAAAKSAGTRASGAKT